MKRTKLLVCVLAIGVLLSACSVDTVNLAQMQNETGVFVFEGLGWGITPEDLATALGVSLTEDDWDLSHIETPGEDGTVYITAKEPVSLLGNEGYARYYFKDNAFCKGEYYLKFDSLNMQQGIGLVRSTNEELTNLFGAPALGDNLSNLPEEYIPSNGDKYDNQWTSEGTGLTLSFLHSPATETTNESLLLLLTVRQE